MRPRLKRVVAVTLGVAILGLLGFAAHTVLPDEGDIAWVFDYVVYYAIIGVAVVATALRAILVREHRAGWTAMAIGVALYGAAEIAWLRLYSDDAEPPYPSVADYLYLGFYPAVYVALVLLFRSRFTGITPGLWIDGLTAALAAGALGSAVVVEAVLDTTQGSLDVVATGLAYPFGDVVLLSLVIAAFSLTAWRPGRAWWLIGAALLTFAVGDSLYLWATATGRYVEGQPLDITWPAALLLIAVAGWLDGAGRRRIDVRGRALLAVPALCAVVAAGILAADHFSRVNLLAIGLCLATLACVLVRLGLAFRENGRLLQRSRTESITDALTGLGNRRRLMIDLAAVFESNELNERLLVIFDLDGFKRYNDSFGHPAGDALLARLGRKLDEAAGDRGTAYRLGGDEFCLLAEVGLGEVERVLDAALDALTEHGEGFAVTCSFGAVTIPEDARDPETALHLADGRLYAQKHGKLTDRDRPHELLLAALYEREPELHSHLAGVADLAVKIGVHLGLAGPEVERLRLAAQLHDIGKIAVPDEILHKTGPLDDAEWDFVLQHPVIGERIVGASAALRGVVGPIVRATHERWDGTGYPDGLEGEEIPLAARIIAACDAFTAMTSDRPYRKALSTDQAIGELQAGAGSQLDPAVVAALVACVRPRASRAT